MVCIVSRQAGVGPASARRSVYGEFRRLFVADAEVPGGPDFYLRVPISISGPPNAIDRTGFKNVAKGLSIVNGLRGLWSNSRRPPYREGRGSPDSSVFSSIIRRSFVLNGKPFAPYLSCSRNV